MTAALRLERFDTAAPVLPAPRWSDADLAMARAAGEAEGRADALVEMAGSAAQRLGTAAAELALRLAETACAEAAARQAAAEAFRPIVLLAATALAPGGRAARAADAITAELARLARSAQPPVVTVRCPPELAPLIAAPGLTIEPAATIELVFAPGRLVIEPEAAEAAILAVIADALAACEATPEPEVTSGAAPQSQQEPS